LAAHKRRPLCRSKSLAADPPPRTTAADGQRPIATAIAHGLDRAGSPPAIRAWLAHIKTEPANRPKDQAPRGPLPSALAAAEHQQVVAQRVSMCNVSRPALAFFVAYGGGTLPHRQV